MWGVFVRLPELLSAPATLIAFSNIGVGCGILSNSFPASIDIITGVFCCISPSVNMVNYVDF